MNARCDDMLRWVMFWQVNCKKKNVEYTNKILFHLYQDSADCQFSRKKKTGFTDLFTRVRSPYIWQTRRWANAPDIVNRQLSATSERALASPLGIDCREYIMDILIFTSSALKTWVLHVNTFYSWILLYISPVTAVNISILSVLYITHLLQLY